MIKALWMEIDRPRRYATLRFIGVRRELAHELSERQWADLPGWARKGMSRLQHLVRISPGLKGEVKELFG